MLTAKKSRWFEKVFAVYNRNLFRRRFNSLKISNLDYLLENRRNDLPTIIYANHSSWWDGLTAFEISRAAGLDAFVMMEEKQLKKLFPFRFLGAFSVVRESPREALKSLNYAGDLLKENQNRSLWIFPQGKILPAEQRPLYFYNGISRIIEKAQCCQLFPVAFRYEFLGDFKPDIFVKIGSPEAVTANKNFNSKAKTKTFEENLTGLLDELKADVTSGNSGNYRNLI